MRRLELERDPQISSLSFSYSLSDDNESFESLNPCIMIKKNPTIEDSRRPCYQSLNEMHERYKEFYETILRSENQEKNDEIFLNILNESDLKYVFRNKVKRPNVMKKVLMRKERMIFVGDTHGKPFILKAIDKLTRSENVRNVFNETFNKDMKSRRSTTYCRREENMPIIVFLGDMVDRSSCSAQFFALLCYVEIYYPHNIVLISGNHEGPDLDINDKYGKKWLSRNSREIIDLMQRTYQNLTIVLIVEIMRQYSRNIEIFCCHGGVTNNIGELCRSIANSDERIPIELIRNILWNDPYPQRSYFDNPRILYSFNKNRNVGQYYSRACIVNEGFDLVIRGHTYESNGYRLSNRGRCLTIFSSVNYNGNMRNDTSIYMISGPNSSNIIEDSIFIYTYESGDLIRADCDTPMRLLP